MSKRKIPKIPITNNSQSEVPQHKVNLSQSAISFSFEILEMTEYFNLDGTCVNWSLELFTKLREISKLTKKDLLSGAYAKTSYRIHSHENANPPSKLPDGVELKDCYQIRLGKSKGGIHGIFSENVFYVIWLDPLHNMYPDDRYGGLRKIKKGSTCCKDRDEQIGLLNDEIKELKQEIKEYEKIFNEL